MRLTALACLLTLAACALAAQREDSRPLSVEIVSSDGRLAEGWDPGNVRVTLTNGHHEMWTRKGKCQLPRVSKSGLVGWTHGTGFHSKGALMNNTLVLARADKVLTRIRTYYSFINIWDFADKDSCVIVLSAGPHGPGRLEKFRIADGELLDGCFEGHTEEWPDWVWPFVEKARQEGTHVE